MRTDQLIERYDLEVVWTQFPLHPETPDAGRSLEDLFAGRDYDLAAMKANMQQRMAQEGLPYGDRSMTYNSRMAQELAKWAETQPGGEAIHDALFKAYFVDGHNLARIDALLAIAGTVGLDLVEAREVLETRAFREAVDLDWSRSRQIGVSGVPTFVAGNMAVVGAQPYEVLEELVQKAGAQPRAASPS